jgi:8-oxo-dGTP diphosphatase
MKHLQTLHQEDIKSCRESRHANADFFREREASRAVLLNDNNEVYMLNVSLHGYHKLPGGGIDEGEEPRQALERELMEEVGCKAEIIVELGYFVEYRDYDNLKQTSYNYLARQVGSQVESALEEGELAEGMYEVKAKSIDEAIALITNDKPNNLEGKFIQIRDLAILKAAKSQLNNS